MRAHNEKATDVHLGRRVLAGDLSAFDALVGQYRQSVLRITGAVLGDWDQAEDTAQEAFMEALGSLRGRGANQMARSWDIIGGGCSDE